MVVLRRYVLPYRHSCGLRSIRDDNYMRSSTNFWLVLIIIQLSLIIGHTSNLNRIRTSIYTVCIHEVRKPYMSHRIIASIKRGSVVLEITIRD